MKSDSEINDIAVAWHERREKIFQKGLSAGAKSWLFAAVIALPISLQYKSLWVALGLSVSIGGIAGGVVFIVLSFALTMASKNPAGELNFEDQARMLLMASKLK